MKDVFKSFVFLNILVLMLFIVDLIPTKLVYSNCLESIKELNEADLIHDLGYMIAIEDVNADASMFNMIMNKDSDHLHNVMKPRLYGIDTQQYLKQVNSYLRHEDISAHEYIQYWHGYRILWIPLLTIFNSRVIKWLSLLLGLVLILVFLFVLYRNKDYYLMIVFSLSSVLFLIPSGFVSLEYIPIVFITLISSILAYRGRVEVKSFMFIGIITAFLDYLTAETLTFTIPCFIMFYKNRIKLVEFIKSGVNWLLGYLGTFFYKYLLLSLIYKDNYFEKIKNIYIEHFVDKNFNFSFGNVLGRQLEVFNSNFLLVNNYVIVIFLVLFILGVYLFRSSKSTLDNLVISLLLYIIPILRFFILSKHSLNLGYMTFRALMICFLITCYYIRYNIIIERRYKNDKRKVKKG